MGDSELILWNWKQYIELNLLWTYYDVLKNIYIV